MINQMNVAQPQKQGGNNMAITTGLGALGTSGYAMKNAYKMQNLPKVNGKALSRFSTVAHAGVGGAVLGLGLGALGYMGYKGLTN